MVNSVLLDSCCYSDGRPPIGKATLKIVSDLPKGKDAKGVIAFRTTFMGSAVEDCSLLLIIFLQQLCLLFLVMFPLLLWKTMMGSGLRVTLAVPVKGKVHDSLKYLYVVHTPPFAQSCHLMQSHVDICFTWLALTIQLNQSWYMDCASTIMH